jgi:hypothetical protein
MGDGGPSSVIGFEGGGGGGEVAPAGVRGGAPSSTRHTKSKGQGDGGAIGPWRTAGVLATAGAVVRGPWVGQSPH